MQICYLWKLWTYPKTKIVGKFYVFIYNLYTCYLNCVVNTPPFPPFPPTCRIIWVAHLFAFLAEILTRCIWEALSICVGLDPIWSHLWRSHAVKIIAAVSGWARIVMKHLLQSPTLVLNIHYCKTMMLLFLNHNLHFICHSGLFNFLFFTLYNNLIILICCLRSSHCNFKDRHYFTGPKGNKISR